MLNKVRNPEIEAKAEARRVERGHKALIQEVRCLEGKRQALKHIEYLAWYAANFNGAYRLGVDLGK